MLLQYIQHCVCRWAFLRLTVSLNNANGQGFAVALSETSAASKSLRKTEFLSELQELAKNMKV